MKYKPRTPTTSPFTRVSLVVEAARLARDRAGEEGSDALVGTLLRPLIEEVADEIAEDPTGIRQRVALWDTIAEGKRKFVDKEAEVSVRLFAADPSSGAMRRRYVNSQVKTMAMALRTWATNEPNEFTHHILEGCMEAAIDRDLNRPPMTFVCSDCEEETPLPGWCFNEECPGA